MYTCIWAQNATNFFVLWWGWGKTLQKLDGTHNPHTPEFASVQHIRAILLAKVPFGRPQPCQFAFALCGGDVSQGQGQGHVYESELERYRVVQLSTNEIECDVTSDIRATGGWHGSSGARATGDATPPEWQIDFASNTRRRPVTTDPTCFPVFLCVRHLEWAGREAGRRCGWSSDH